MELFPEPGTETFGRTEFFIHGDNSTHTASHGCLIFGSDIRKRINDETDRRIEVIE